MASKTLIPWTNSTWNIVTGCEKVSSGCKFCYVERDWSRYANNPKTVYYGRAFTDVQVHPERLDQPLRWSRPRLIFVTSQADLFHRAVPTEFIDEVFAIIGLSYVMNRGHVFQILTKRPERMRDYLLDPDTIGRVTHAMKRLGPQDGLPGENSPPTWPLPNLWLGVSAEDQKTANERVPLLLATPAAVRWISSEPLIARLSFRWAPWVDRERQLRETGREWHLDGFRGIDWFVVGAESGPHARWLDDDLVRALVRECAEVGVPCFVKQLSSPSTRNKVVSDLSLFPSDLQVRRYPIAFDGGVE